MEQITVPENLSDLDDEALNELREEIREAAQALSGDAASDDEALSEMERLVAQFDRISNELDARAEKAEERRARAEQVLSRLTDTVDEPEFEIEDADIIDDTDEVPADDVAASDENAEEFEVEGPVDESAEVEAPVAEAEAATVEEPVVEASAEDITTSEASAAETTEAAIEEAPAPEEAVEVENTDNPEFATEEASVAEASEEATTTPEPDSPAQFDQEVEIVEDTPTRAVASTSTRPTVSELRRSRPAAVEPQESEVRRAGATLLASNAVQGHEGAVLDIPALADAIAKKAHGLNSTSAAGHERVVMATAKAEFATKLGGGAEENFSILEAVRRQHAADRAEVTALVASGGNCAPLEPSYEFFRLAEELNPVEQCLPVVEAPRGGIRFITPPDFRDASGGVRVTTEAEDAAGYPPTAPKPCVSVVCPPVEECRVDAVSQCVEFGNLNFRVFPEQVEAFLADLGVIFTETKEVFYLDAIDAGSTAVTSTPAYGATRGIVQDLAAASAAYRRRNHMSPDATLQLLLPSWVVEFVKVDMVNDHSMGLGFLTVDTAAVLAELAASLNLDVCLYYDSATGAGQAFNDPQAAGALNPFPSTVVSYLFAPGTFVRLDGGTLDVGLIRDSALNGTNDLQIFSEQWIQVCKVGLESVRIEHTLCPDGTAPEPVPPLVCP